MSTVPFESRKFLKVTFNALRRVTQAGIQKICNQNSCPGLLRNYHLTWSDILRHHQGVVLAL
jgi:hypothetical protein